MNQHDLKRGDRVRVTARNCVVGYRPGDTGEIVRLVLGDRTGEIGYAVQMDKNPLKTPPTVFFGDEIEPDV
jgi:hypothetical protein